MKRRTLLILALLLTLALLIPASLIFVPRSYPVPPFRERPSTRWWDLPTGSHIGYQVILPDSNEKPFPVLFLQGGPGAPVSGDNLILFNRLATEGYKVYLYDLAGCGHSGRFGDIRDYTVKRHVDDLTAIVEAIGTEKVILIGQSWGAMLAVQYLAEHPGRIEKAVFTGPGPILPVRTELASVPAPDSLNLREPLFTNRMASDRVQNLRSRAISWAARRLGVKLASDREADDFQALLDRELVKATLCDTSRHSSFSPGGGFYCQVMTVNDFQRTTDPRPAIRSRNATFPVLVIRGQCDHLPWGYAAEYLDLFPDSRLAVIPGAGHSAGREQPEVFIRTIADFLRE